ncbi:hypothetical protein HK096_010769, partial [Nowakowskiella sp. JEL0078]
MNSSLRTKPKKLKTDIPLSHETNIPISLPSFEFEKSIFSIHPIERFRSMKAQCQQPTEITYFSYNGERKLFLNSNQTLKLFHPPNLKVLAECDLNDGFPEKFITKDNKPEGIDALLKSISDVNRRAVEDGKREWKPKVCT